MLRKYDIGWIRGKVFVKLSGINPKPHCRSVSSQEHLVLTVSDCMTGFKPVKLEGASA